VSDDGKTLYVLGMPGLTRVALPALTVEGPVKASGIGYSDAAISRDGRRAYTLFGEYFTTHDLQKGEKVADVRTGKMGTKMLLALETGLKTETARLTSENTARREGRSYYSYTEYTLRAPRGTMAVRPDGKAVYALNSQTSDVTVIDAESGQVLEKVSAGGFAVRFMPAASVALVADSDAVHAIDLTSHKKLADVAAAPTGNLGQIELSPDAERAVVHGSGAVVTVNVVNGKAVGTTKTFGKVADVVVDWGRAR
jgi:YVTN family beta-propeller protein